MYKAKYITMYSQKCLFEFNIKFGYQFSAVGFLSCFANVLYECQPPAFKTFY